MNTMSAVPAQRGGNAIVVNAGFVLSLVLIVLVAAFGCWVVGTRGIEIGTDTSVYAAFYERVGHGLFETRLEPGFVLISYLLNKLGLGVTGYQTALFALLLLIVCVSTRRYFGYLGATHGYLTFLTATLMLLYLSPMFVNASTNAIRQGLAALLVFAALLSFQQRRWWLFVLYGALASSLHLSSLLYLAFAPALFLSARLLRYVAAFAFVVYCTGLSLMIVRAVAPAAYILVMNYAVNLDFQSGVRIDFAVFSIFWYALPLLLAPLVRSPYRERIKESTAIYLVMLLPFFMVGWGYFSNRYLLPAWLATSLVLAAIACHARIGIVRNPLMIRIGLVASCAVFYVFVTNEIVI